MNANAWFVRLRRAAPDTAFDFICVYLRSVASSFAFDFKSISSKVLPLFTEPQNSSSVWAQHDPDHQFHLHLKTDFLHKF